MQVSAGPNRLMPQPVAVLALDADCDLPNQFPLRLLKAFSGVLMTDDRIEALTFLTDRRRMGRIDG